MNRRSLIQALGATLLGAAIGAPALAQNAAYPSQSIRIILPWPPGGLTDTIGRLIAQTLGDRLGQSVYVDNRPGASGNIGTAQAARAAPDGYTLLLASSTPNSANPHLYSHLGFDPRKDFAGIGLIATAPNVLLVRADSPYQTANDLIAAVRAQPGKLTYGSAGTASSGHLAGSTFTHVFKLDMLHVPYKGAGPALVDLMSGQIDVMLDPSALPHIRSGKLRALAVPATRRLPALPDVPTFEEATGTQGMIASAWYGLAAPAGTPPAILERLNRELNAVLESPAVKQQLIDFGADPRGMSTPEFDRFMQSEIDRYGRIIKDADVKIE